MCVTVIGEMKSSLLKYISNPGEDNHWKSELSNTQLTVRICYVGSYERNE